MNKTDSWLLVSTSKLAPRMRLRIVAGATEKNAVAHLIDVEKPDPNLPLWHRTSTTIVAQDENPRTGAAILPTSFVGHSEIPRVTGWRKIMMQLAKETGCRDTAFVFDFLLDIEFQHHLSTNGRMNPDLNRWERYAVRSVADWCKSGINDPKERQTSPARVSDRTLRNIKNKLTEAGLIEASTHLWQGDNHLWIKPTDELSRILFEPGYWQTLQPATEPKAKAKKLKPRGLSAIYAEIDDKALALYRQVTAGKLDDATEAVRWAVWHQLTKPVAVGKSGRMKEAFAAEGSYRRKKLYEALGLAFK